MRIITHTCSECGTVVAGNVLYRRHTVPCPGLDCTNVLRLTDLPESERHHLRDHWETYTTS